MLTSSQSIGDTNTATHGAPTEKPEEAADKKIKGGLPDSWTAVHASRESKDEEVTNAGDHSAKVKEENKGSASEKANGHKPDETKPKIPVGMNPEVPRNEELQDQSSKGPPPTPQLPNEKKTQRRIRVRSKLPSLPPVY